MAKIIDETVDVPAVETAQAENTVDATASAKPKRKALVDVHLDEAALENAGYDAENLIFEGVLTDGKHVSEAVVGGERVKRAPIVGFRVRYVGENAPTIKLDDALVVPPHGFAKYGIRNTKLTHGEEVPSRTLPIGETVSLTHPEMQILLGQIQFFGKLNAGVMSDKLGEGALLQASSKPIKGSEADPTLNRFAALTLQPSRAGKAVAKKVLDADGKPVTDENGKVVYEAATDSIKVAVKDYGIPLYDAVSDAVTGESPKDAQMLPEYVEKFGALDSFGTRRSGGARKAKSKEIPAPVQISALFAK